MLILLLLAGFVHGDNVQNGINAIKKKDYNTASKLFQKACDGGVASGCNNLGVIYANGFRDKQSYEYALKYFDKACDMKYEEGCKNYTALKKRAL